MALMRFSALVLRVLLRNASTPQLLKARGFGPELAAMRGYLAIAVTALAAVCLAQDKEKIPPISPDRPDFTDGAGITPLGKWLLELGYRQTHSGGATLQEFGDQPVLRYGYRDNVEFRLTAPAYATGAGTSGFEDSAIGIKWLIKDGGDAKGFKSPSYAIEAGTTFPSGSNAFRSRKLQPSAIGIVDWDFGQCGDLGANVGVAVQEDFTVWSASLSYDRSFNERLAGFVESYALFPGSPGGPSDHFADTGVQFLVNNDCMLDAFVGSQLDRHRQSAFFGAGVSFRF